MNGHDEDGQATIYGKSGRLGCGGQKECKGKIRTTCSSQDTLVYLYEL